MYRVLTSCILSITSRNILKMRSSHSFFLYALCQQLDIDIALHMFHNIIHASGLITRLEIHMPYCHVLTYMFSTLEIDTTQGRVTSLSPYDEFGQCQLALVHVDITAQGILA